jgi:hypothetical protein
LLVFLSAGELPQQFRTIALRAHTLGDLGGQHGVGAAQHRVGARQLDRALGAAGGELGVGLVELDPSRLALATLCLQPLAPAHLLRDVAGHGDQPRDPVLCVAQGRPDHVEVALLA